jgi:hypothetical protein
MWTRHNTSEENRRSATTVLLKIIYYLFLNYFDKFILKIIFKKINKK